jgi:hypothetical protein
VDVNSNTVVLGVGRLMEICTRAGFRTVEDVETQRSLINRALDGFPADQRIVIAADWRTCEVMTQSAASALGAMLASYNARIERSAILGSARSPLAVLQFLRVVRETRHPGRRVFEDRRPMLAYLGECLSPVERDRLDQFLLA